MSNTPLRPLGGRLITPTTVALAILVIIGGYFIVQRYMHGLGAVTNLNQGYPWGLWIAVDIVIGTAFGCGGFAIALLVYIFNKTNTIH